MIHTPMSSEGVISIAGAFPPVITVSTEGKWDENKPTQNTVAHMTFVVHVQ